MREAVLAAALLLATPQNVAAEQPATATHAMPDLFAGRHEAVMTGAQSPYKGRFYRAKQRAYALCTLKRESNNHWYSTNRASGYFGGRQFSKALTHGVTYMMTAELVHLYGEKLGRSIARELRAHEMHKWLPIWQDMAFWTVINWKRDGAGMKHFSGGRWGCAS